MTESHTGFTTGRAPLRCTTVVYPNDVLFGRGSPSYHNEGNIRLRKLVEARGHDYAATNKHDDKTKVAAEVVQIVLQRKGRFLRKIESVQELTQFGVPDEAEEAYVIVDDTTIFKKVKQLLREQKLRKHPQQSSKSPGSPLTETNQNFSIAADDDLPSDKAELKKMRPSKRNAAEFVKDSRDFQSTVQDPSERSHQTRKFKFKPDGSKSTPAAALLSTEHSDGHDFSQSETKPDDTHHRDRKKLRQLDLQEDDYKTQTFTRVKTEIDHDRHWPSPASFPISYFRQNSFARLQNNINLPSLSNQESAKPTNAVFQPQRHPRTIDHVIYLQVKDGNLVVDPSSAVPELRLRAVTQQARQVSSSPFHSALFSGTIANHDTQRVSLREIEGGLRRPETEELHDQTVPRPLI